MKFFHPHYINCLAKAFSMRFWTIVNRISAKFWRVSLGKNAKFQGHMIFRTLPGASITIGESCVFLSNHSSNLIGIYSPCAISTISRDATIKIGNNCGFSGTVVASAMKIEIGDNVRCGANTLITDTDWHSDDPRVSEDAPVIIDEGVWLGYGVKVLKGVHIGANSVIGAESVVTRNIPANVVAAGNPCKIIREL